jgi:hypothetical protein
MASTQSLIRISTGQVYLNLFGQYWWIFDEATLAGVFGSNPSITDVTSLPSGAQLGPTLAPGSGILQPDGSDNLYLVCTGLKPVTSYFITSQDVQAYFQFNGPVQTCNNQTISNWLMALIADGQNITMPSVATAVNG